MIGRDRKCGRKQAVWIRMGQDEADQTQHTSEQRLSTHSFLLNGAGDEFAGRSRRLVLHESPNTTISVVWRLQTFFARVIGWYEGRCQATNSKAEIASSTTTLRRAKSFMLSFVSMPPLWYSWLGRLCLYGQVIGRGFVSRFKSNQIDSVLVAAPLSLTNMYLDRTLEERYGQVKTR